MIPLLKTFPLSLLAISLCLISCNNRGNVDSKVGRTTALEEITAHIDSTTGFKDIFLSIDSNSLTDSTGVYIAKGLYLGKPVGARFEVKRNMGSGISSSGTLTGNGFIINGVRISSIGTQSDEFIRGLSELYKNPTNKPFTKGVVEATAFSLNDKVADLDKRDYYKFKLFFENKKDSGATSEVFFNLDLNKGIIELPKKMKNIEKR